jgi:hypothetical protein
VSSFECELLPLGRFSLRGIPSEIKSRTIMHDISEPLISCEIDMGKQGMALAKTTLNHVVCAIKTPHRAVQVGITRLSDTVSQNAKSPLSVQSCDFLTQSQSHSLSHPPKADFIHLAVPCTCCSAGPSDHALLHTRGFSRFLRTRSKAPISRSRLGFECGSWRSLARLGCPGRLGY